MHKRLPHSLASTFVFAALVLAPYVLAQDTDGPGARGATLPDAASLLDKAEAAIGPAKKRAALTSMRATGTVHLEGVGGGRFEELHLDDKAKYTVTYESFGGVTQGTDGTMSWSTDPAMGITVKRGHDQDPVRRLFAIGRLAPWRSLYSGAKTVQEVALDGRSHYQIEMQPAHGKTETWFVDPAVNAVRRVDLALPDPMGGELACQFWFADWKEIDGLRFPHKKTQKVGVYAIEFTYDRIEPNAKLTATDVAPSEQVMAAAEDATKQSQKAPTEAGVFSVETLVARPALSIRVQVAKDRVGPTLAVLLPEVMAHLSKAGVSPAGPPFSRYHGTDKDGKLDLEAGMPVAKKVEGKGRVQASELPGGKAAMTWHIGPFETLEESYAALGRWIEANRLTSAGAYWEVYWTDPGIEPDASKWRTQVLWPVK